MAYKSRYTIAIGMYCLPIFGTGTAFRIAAQSDAVNKCDAGLAGTIAQAKLNAYSSARPIKNKLLKRLGLIAGE